MISSVRFYILKMYLDHIYDYVSHSWKVFRILKHIVEKTGLLFPSWWDLVSFGGRGEWLLGPKTGRIEDNNWGLCEVRNPARPGNEVLGNAVLTLPSLSPCDSHFSFKPIPFLPAVLSKLL